MPLRMVCLVPGVDTSRGWNDTDGSALWGASCPRQGLAHPLRFVARRTFFQPGTSGHQAFLEGRCP